MRLDQYLALHWPEYSRSTWQKYCKSGYVSVNGEVQTEVKTLLSEDDAVTIHIPPEPDHSSATLPILFENESIVVINKPAGILSHAKGAVSEEFTVADFMKPRTSAFSDTNRPGIVHRLDRATSGVMVCVRDIHTARHMQKQFANRNVKKQYIAIVYGHPKVDHALIDAPIDRNQKAPSTFKTHASGKPAQTQYRVLDSRDDYSMVDLRPSTGRTHQLRVHMAHIGCPIVGDIVYGKANDTQPRMYLHAYSIELTLPDSSRQTFTAPVPKSFLELFPTKVEGLLYE